MTAGQLIHQSLRPDQNVCAGQDDPASPGSTCRRFRHSVKRLPTKTIPYSGRYRYNLLFPKQLKPEAKNDGSPANTHIRLLP